MQEPRASRHLRQIRLVSGILALCMLGLIAYLSLWSDGPRVRYAMMTCFYQQIYSTAGPVHAVVLGTSRTKYGVEMDTLATGLGLDPLTDGVVNMGRGGRGTGQLYRELLDIDAERGVRGPIILEYVPSDSTIFTKEPLYYHYKPNYAVNVPFSDLLADWDSKPREPSYSRLRDFASQLQQKLDASIQTALVGLPKGNDAIPVDRRPAVGAQSCMTNPRSRVVRRWGQQEGTLEARERKVAARVGEGGTWRDQPSLDWDLSVVNQDAQEHYVKKIIAFGRERGVPVYLMLVPGYLEMPPSPAFLAEFERRFGVPLLYPSDEVREELNREGGYYFQDSNHLNRRGNVLYAKWLAEEIQRQQGQAT